MCLFTPVLEINVPEPKHHCLLPAVHVFSPSICLRFFELYFTVPLCSIQFIFLLNASQRDEEEFS
jgi:hypothetical protein